MLRNLTTARGFSAAEAAIILSAMSVLAGATAPVLGGYLDEARMTRAREETRVVATAVVRLQNDLLARTGIPGGLGTLQMAASEGDVPAVATDAGSTWGGTGAGIGALNDHLMVNAVGYPIPGSDLPAGVRGWSGPYLDRPLGADPWGRRYVVRFGRGKVPTLVLSAGPDGVVSSGDGPTGFVVGGDDIISVISSR